MAAMPPTPTTLAGTSSASPRANLGPMMLSVTTVLFWLAFVVYSLRILSRIRPIVVLGLDDLFISIAMALGTAEWGLAIASVHYGMGKHTSVVTQEQGSPSNALHLLFGQVLVHFWCLAFTKLSWACTLLRIKREKSWQVLIWSLASIVVVAAIGASISQFIQCKPLAAVWDTSISNATCFNPQQKQISLYAVGVVVILTDLIFSLLPITFIRKLNRSTFEKIGIACLMGLGILATIAGIVKTAQTGGFVTTTDPLFDATPSATLGNVEEYLGIFAVCAPCLRSSIERTLKRFGLLSTSTGNTYGSMNFSAKRSGANPTIISRGLRHTGSEQELNILKGRNSTESRLDEIRSQPEVSPGISKETSF